MKEIKSIAFGGYLLIPAKSVFEDPSDLCFVGGKLEVPMDNSFANIYVIFFSCDKADEMLPIINTKIESLKDLINKTPVNKYDSLLFDLFSELKENIQTPIMHKEESLKPFCEELLSVVYNYHAIPCPDRKEVIFLSWVSSMVES